MVCNGGLPVSKKNESGLKRKDYERRLQELHVMLVGLQEWVRQEGKKICIVFEVEMARAKAAPSRPSPRA